MQPFRTILFGADFSDNSHDAFRAACSIAVDSQTRVIVVHVAEPNLVPEEPVYFGQAGVQFYDAGADRSHLESLKTKLREVYVPNHPVNVEYHTREGEPAQEILRLAQETGSDLIAMGTHGRTGLRWLLAGSVATAVMRRARCPVLALRSAEVRPEPADVGVILHPTDFSAESRPALQLARALARDLGARLIVLHVAALDLVAGGAITSPVDPSIYKEALEDIRRRVDGPDLKYPAETQIVRGDAADGILQAADLNKCDLIVMGTHGRSGLGRLLMGSVAEFVLPRASCAVLVVKSAQPAAAATAERPVAKTVTVS
jgi:nucleotide-binding universal stress UspA family protein